MIWFIVLVIAPVIIGIAGLIFIVKLDMDSDFNPSRDKLERYNARRR